MRKRGDSVSETQSNQLLYTRFTLGSFAGVIVILFMGKVSAV